jgi:hypothetical protein
MVHRPLHPSSGFDTVKLTYWRENHLLVDRFLGCGGLLDRKELVMNR